MSSGGLENQPISHVAFAIFIRVQFKPTVFPKDVLIRAAFNMIMLAASSPIMCPGF